MDIHQAIAFECSKIVTQKHSTSFTLGIKSLHPNLHRPVYAIYGFVRSADEIVDTFHEYDKEQLFKDFRKETYKAIKRKISVNPVLHSFQLVFHKYNIDIELVDAFLDSMEMDLYFNTYNLEKYKAYIYGSAEVVGLMCLKVFCDGREEQYQKLKEPAKKLGSALQKVNFLRDMKSDFKDRGRSYFPGMDFQNFTLKMKSDIEKDIQNDFNDAYKGILQLPRGCRLGVYLAYVYYLKLFKKIKTCPVTKIASERIRINDNKKAFLLVESYFRHTFNFL